MSEGALIVLALLVMVWALTSKRLGRVGLSGPMVFLLAGLLVSDGRFGGIDVSINTATVHAIADITLALVLFTDAAQVELRTLFRGAAWPARLLGIGFPLSLIVGTVVAALTLHGIPWQAAALACAATVATDAALSAGLIGDERLPERVRLALNVESGLNDGLATPFVTIAIAATATAIGVEGEHGLAVGEGHALRALAIGLVAGGLLGWAGGRLTMLAHRKGWTEAGGRRLSALAIAVLSYVAIDAASGNGFVAAFVAGIAFGAATRGEERTVVEYPQLVADVLAWTTWFIFGAALVVPALEDVHVSTAIFAVCTLTIVRMVPVAIALMRGDSDRPTRWFLGWFGPRGLASVVFALLIAEELPTADHAVQTVIAAITLTVVMSVVLHGITATPFVRTYIRGREPEPTSG